MKMVAKILRFLDPETEKLRMDVRDAMAMANAHAEDVSRTVAIHGDKIAEMLKQYGHSRKLFS